MKIAHSLIALETVEAPADVHGWFRNFETWQHRARCDLQAVEAYELRHLIGLLLIEPMYIDCKNCDQTLSTGDQAANSST